MNIEDLVKKSANAVFNLLTGKGEPCKNRLIYPFYTEDSSEYKKGDVRCSEQELKQLFIENICECTNYYYSVETPTDNAYSFSDRADKNNKTTKISKNKGEQDNRKYESALIDLSLYNSKDAKNPECHIEFKNGRPGEKDIKKDILKLIVEGQNTKNFFIHINVLDGDKVKASTKESLRKKFTKSYSYAQGETKSEYTQHNVTVYIIYICKGMSNPVIEKKEFCYDKDYKAEEDGKTEWTQI